MENKVDTYIMYAEIHGHIVVSNVTRLDILEPVSFSGLV
jgi:hypothetical protein